MSNTETSEEWGLLWPSGVVTDTATRDAAEEAIRFLGEDTAAMVVRRVVTTRRTPWEKP